MTANKTDYHNPVMLNECIQGLNIDPEGVYVDVTFGGGGHSREIFKHLSEKGRLLVFDQDPDAAANAWSAPNFTFIPANFEFLANHLRLNGIKQVDGILADLGVSSHQFDEESRGFSIRTDAPLDMRMNQHGALSAWNVVNEYEEQDLIDLLRKYGELPNARRIAGEILRARSSRKIKTTGQLMEALAGCSPKFKDHKFFAQVFQSIRIEVNREMDALEKFLEQTAEVMHPGGRLVVMSYHSLEDRLVKNYMKRGSLDGEISKDFFGNVLKPFTEINRHPIVPTEEELEKNTRSRSAKLRIAERNG